MNFTRPRWFVFTLAVAMLALNARASLPDGLQKALETFRTDPPKGWSFTLTTAGEGKSTVERCNAMRPEFDRWTLVQVDGRPPVTEELARYGDNRSRRSRGGTAPNIIQQLDISSIETVSETPERLVARFRLKPGETTDKTAAFLRATLTFHKPTATIESLELANIGEFSPAIGVKISEMKTVMTYSLPTPDAPSLPQKVLTRQRGTAFWFKSLDAELSVTFSDYERVGKR